MTFDDDDEEEPKLVSFVETTLKQVINELFN